MQRHVNHYAVLVFRLRFDRDSLDDGCSPLDLALKLQPVIFIDSSNKNVLQKRGQFISAGELRLKQMIE